MSTDKKLIVKNLAVSFRTDNGKLRAVRDISLGLNNGETLAIVGESGSGKSVTSKAIMGILAGNAIIESGEIIYDGRDLLKISEKDFGSIRGDKIAMIFQNPLSSLNPIVKIGRQLTEAMLLKGKARQRESRAAFNTLLACLRSTIAITIGDENGASIAAELCKRFDTFEYKHLELEGEYNVAREAAADAAYELESLILEIEKDAARDMTYRVKRVARLAKISIHEYVVNEHAGALKAYAADALDALSSARGGDIEARAKLVRSLSDIKEILEGALSLTAPDFFAMGFYLTGSFGPLPDIPVEELNLFLRKHLDEGFMLDFIARVREALVYSAYSSLNKKREAIDALCKYRYVFGRDRLAKRECEAALEKMNRAVLEAIDRLELVKDSFSYTFFSGMKGEINRYFDAVKRNPKEEKRFEKQKAAYDARSLKGGVPDFSPIPADVTDLATVRRNMLRQIDRLVENLEKRIAGVDARDFDSEAVAVIDYLKAQASGVAHRVTKSMAKSKALKLMAEVGIPDARLRYNQYPFQFSGGMRQRIVIAIALAADPDILICDEPTTALDVTIQAQILELIDRLKRERNISVIFITHDLGVVANIADRIAVMYAGRIVEEGTAEDVFYDPRHPYTWALLSSMPDLDTRERLEAIPGTPPNMIYPPVGDAFAARNRYAMRIDFEMEPPTFRISDTHYAATWLLHPDAPRVEIPGIIRARIERMKEVRGDAE